MEKKENKFTPNEISEDKKISLRPKKITEFVGQDNIKSNLKTFIESSIKTKKNLDHIILYGPPGLGKTTLANIISYEKNVNIHVTSGPAFTKKGDLVTLLSNLSKGDILFIDEIHRLSPVIEESLYPAMEDFKCDYIIGSGPSARVMQIAIEKSKILFSSLIAILGVPLDLFASSKADVVSILTFNFFELRIIISFKLSGL